MRFPHPKETPLAHPSTAPRDGCFERVDVHRHKPTAHADGARDPDERHPSPPGGPVAHALGRQPRGTWAGRGTTAAFGPSGQGLTSTVLHDVDGPCCPGPADPGCTARRLIGPVAAPRHPV